MSFKHKYTFEEKERIILEYQAGTHGFRELCRIYGMAQQALKDWIRLYEIFGMEGLKTESKASCYSKEVKEAAIQDYLMHTLPVKEILIKYRIRSTTQLKRWVKKYNGHEKLKASRTGGTAIMTKDSACGKEAGRNGGMCVRPDSLIVCAMVQMILHFSRLESYTDYTRKKPDVIVAGGL